MTKETKALRSDPVAAASANGAGIGAAQQASVGFIGLGRMGTVMAANLAAAGYRVIALVRRPDRFAQLQVLGLEPTVRMTDLLGCEFIVSMLPDDAAASEVVLGRGPNAGDGLASGLRPGAVHISMSTISTAAAARLAAEHALHGHGYVA